MRDVAPVVHNDGINENRNGQEFKHSTMSEGCTQKYHYELNALPRILACEIIMSK